jgi:hypothetical protein
MRSWASGRTGVRGASPGRLRPHLHRRILLLPSPHGNLRYLQGKLKEVNIYWNITTLSLISTAALPTKKKPFYYQLKNIKNTSCCVTDKFSLLVKQNLQGSIFLPTTKLLLTRQFVAKNFDIKLQKVLYLKSSVDKFKDDMRILSTNIVARRTNTKKRITS